MFKFETVLSVGGHPVVAKFAEEPPDEVRQVMLGLAEEEVEDSQEAVLIAMMAIALAMFQAELDGGRIAVMFAEENSHGAANELHFSLGRMEG